MHLTAEQATRTLHELPLQCNYRGQPYKVDEDSIDITSYLNGTYTIS
jgi:hypothetical protein